MRDAALRNPGAVRPLVVRLVAQSTAPTRSR